MVIPLQVSHTMGSKCRTICICMQIMDGYLVLARTHHLIWELLDNLYRGTCKCFEVFLWPTVKDVGMLHGYVYKFYTKQLKRHAVLGQLMTDCNTHPLDTAIILLYLRIQTNLSVIMWKICVWTLQWSTRTIASDYNLASIMSSKVVRIQHTCIYVQVSD